MPSLPRQWWAFACTSHDDGTIDPQRGNSCFAHTFYTPERGSIVGCFDHVIEQAVKLPPRGDSSVSLCVVFSDTGYGPGNSIATMARAIVPFDKLWDAAEAHPASKTKPGVASVCMEDALCFLHTQEPDARWQDLRVHLTRPVAGPARGTWRVSGVEVVAPEHSVKHFTDWLAIYESKCYLTHEQTKTVKE